MKKFEIFPASEITGGRGGVGQKLSNGWVDDDIGGKGKSESRGEREDEKERSLEVFSGALRGCVWKDDLGGKSQTKYQFGNAAPKYNAYSGILWSHFALIFRKS